MTHERQDESCETYRETDGGFKAPTQEQKQMVWSDKDQTMQKNKKYPSIQLSGLIPSLKP